MNRNPRTGRFEKTGTPRQISQPTLFDIKTLKDRISRNVDRLFLTNRANSTNV